jgi:ABC-type multidrug transport system permease subunit
MEAMLVLDAYGNGGFQRQHSLVDLIIIAALYLASAALWPLLVVLLILVYFGVLPGGIWDL